MAKSWADYFYDNCVFVDAYKGIRPDILDLFQEFYMQPGAKEYRENVDVNLLRQQATLEYHDASDFAPSEQILNLIQIINQVWKIVKFIFYVLILIASIVSFQFIRRISLEALTLGDAILSLSILPPSIMAFLGIYIYLISANSRIIYRFNQDLAVSPGVISTYSRDESQLFAYLIWNRSLRGSKMHVGLGILNIINSVRPSFYKFILDSMTTNADVFLEGRGKISIVRELYHRHRDDENQNQKVKKHS